MRRQSARKTAAQPKTKAEPVAMLAATLAAALAAALRVLRLCTSRFCMLSSSSSRVKYAPTARQASVYGVSA